MQWTLRLQEIVTRFLPKYLPPNIERELNAELSLIHLETNQSRRRGAGKNLIARLDELTKGGYDRSQIIEYVDRLDKIITTGHDPHPRSDLDRSYRD